MLLYLPMFAFSSGKFPTMQYCQKVKQIKIFPDVDDTCPLCCSNPESLDHLLLDVNFPIIFGMSSGAVLGATFLHMGVSNSGCFSGVEDLEREKQQGIQGK